MKNFYDYLDIRANDGADIPAPVSFILKLIFTSASIGMVVILVLSNI
jgi:hypothetical protein